MSNHVSRTLTALVALLMVVALAGCTTGGGASGSGGSISASDAWARPAAAGAETAVYLTIANTGSSADALISATSPGASSVEMHQTSTDMNGMTGMSPVARIDVPAGQTVSLAPGGMHLMVTGLTSGLEVGGSIDVALVFEHAGTVQVTAEVRQP